MDTRRLSSPHVQLVELFRGDIEDRTRHLHTTHFVRIELNIKNVGMLPNLRVAHWGLVRGIGEYCHTHTKVTRNQAPLPPLREL